MSAAKTNIRKIEQEIAPLAESLGLALLDVLHVHEGGRTVLRLIIDKKGGVGIEDCEKLSGLADSLISDQLGFDDFDVFEVSSPGFDRPLTSLEDCLRHEGEWVRISLYQNVEGGKRFLGKLLVDGEQVGVETEEGEIRLFPFEAIAQVKREVVF